jgi:hypothetical protein
MRNVIRWFVVMVLLLSVSLVLIAGGRIRCKEDNCGPNCQYGTCVDASSCAGCIIHACLDDITHERGDWPCTAQQQ